MDAKKSVNRSKYWKGALQFAKRNTDDIEVVSPYNPLLDKYFDNQVDMVSIKTVVRNATAEDEKLRKNNVDKSMSRSNSKTSMNELTKEKCTKVEKHIKEVFQELVINKHNEIYEGRSNEVKDAQFHHNYSTFTDRENCFHSSLYYQPQDYMSCAINDYRNVYEP